MPPRRDGIQAQLDETVKAIRAVTAAKPEIGLTLGSGLGALADEIEDAEAIPYSQLPNFPVSHVPGHSGRLVIGRLEGKTVAALQGRVHFYEGYSLAEVTYSVRVLSALGVKTFIVTNSAGAVNREFDPGDLMLITDHLNLVGDNPLRGAYDGDPGGQKFIDLTEAYDPDLIDVARRAARALKQKIRTGVYAASYGPSYETPAEVRMLRTLGADAIGMSTVPEVIVARDRGIRVLGISCISNRAAGLAFHPLSHAEVLETTAKVSRDFRALVRRIVKGC